MALGSRSEGMNSGEESTGRPGVDYSGEALEETSGRANVDYGAGSYSETTGRPGVDYSGEEEGAYVPQSVKESEEIFTPLTAPVDPDAITTEFFHSANAQKSINMFMVERYGSAGSKQKDESKEEYAERFFTNMRWMQNNVASTGLGLSWLHGASKETKANFGVLYTAFDDMPAFYEDGGGDAMSGVIDSVLSTVLDPTMVATLGLAAGVKMAGGRLAAKTALSMALKGNKARIIGATSVDGILGAVQAGAVQSLEKEAGVRDELDTTNIVAAGLLTAGFSGVVNAAAFKLGLNNQSYKDKLQDTLRESRVKQGLDPDLKSKGMELYDPTRTAAEQIAESTTLFDELNVLNKLEARTDKKVTYLTVQELSDAKVIAAELMDAVPSLAPRSTESISDAFHRVFFTLDNADDALLKKISGSEFKHKGDLADSLEKLKGILDRDGISASQFGAIVGMDASIAGKILNQHSQLSKVADKLRGVTPKMNKDVAAAKREDILNASWAMRVLQGLGTGTKKLDRMRRAIMTSQPATTARNTVSGVASVTGHTASRLLRNTFVAIGDAGKAVAHIDGAKPSFDGTVDGLQHIVSDGFSLLADLSKTGYNRELTDLILTDHKKLHHVLLRTTQEAGTNSLPKTVMMLNSLNIAQDQFLRTGVFTNSVHRQMKDLLGIKDVTAHLAAGKKIPTEIAKRAVDDALDMTFASMPQNSMAKGFIKLVENLPFAPVIGTGAFPFARFMSNAISFQFRYFPSNSVISLFTAQTARNMAKANTAGAKEMSEKAVRQFNDGIVGFAAIAAAIKYRSEHQDDSNYNEYVKEDGTTVDMSAMFPIPFYMFIGDLYVKVANGTAGNLTGGDYSQGLTGMQVRGADFNYMITNFADAFGDIGTTGVSSEKLGEMLGKYTGDMLGQFVTPAKVVRDVLAAFDEEQSMMRDPNIIESKGIGNRFVESAVKKAVVNLPTQVQEFFTGDVLPPAQSAVKGEDQYRVAPLLTQATGLKVIPKRSAVENELITKGIKPYLMLTPTGDKEADALIRKHMPTFLDDVVGSIIDTEYYKNTTLADQKLLLGEAKAMVLEFAKESAQEDYAEVRSKKGYSPEMKAKWVRTPKNLRRAVNERYMQMNGSTIEDANAYDAGVEIASSLRGRAQ
tara:strand:- start:296 stop:3715 length:3420 start_codon:yes stop_codon:yes gene_type:complete